MSAEILRKAASLMRERAKAATPGPWLQVGGDVEHYFPSIGESGVVANALDVEAAHIAAWHPAVAIAVADLLDAVAAEWIGVTDIIDPEALAVARAYLGESA